MLATDKDNMREAYLAYERENNERVKYVQTELQKQGGFGAEIVPETEGKWLIVVTMPGEEGLASAHLIARRFSIYQPLVRDVRITRGRKIERMRPMYRNYLFVYAWDVKRHARRILSCPGTHHLLTKEDGLTPVEVPWSVINEIRAVENRENPMLLRVEQMFGSKKIRRKKNKKGRWRAEAPEAKQEAEDHTIVRVYPFGFSRSLGTWDDEAEVSALHKALGLAA